MAPANAVRSAASQSDRRAPDVSIWVPVLLPAVVMTALGVWGLRRRGAMGNDEVATRWISGLGLRQMAHVLNHLDAVHGLYYLLIHFWSVLGDSPVMLRVPSLIAMAAAVGVIGVIGTRLTGSAAAGTVAGVAAAVTPSVSFYAQTARSYALVYLVVAVSSLTLISALDREASGRAAVASRWLPYGVLVVLAGYLNELSLTLLAAHLVTMVIIRPGRRATMRWLVASVLGAVAVVPLVLVSRRESAALAHIDRPGLGDVRILFHEYFGTVTAAAVLFSVAALVAVARAVVPAQGVGVGRRRSVVPVALPLLVVPPGLLLAESAVGKPLFLDRYVLFAGMGAALLVGDGLGVIGRWLVAAVAHDSRSRRRPALWLLALVPGVAVCVLALVLQLGVQHRIRTPDSRLFNFGGPSADVGAHSRQGDAVLFFDAFYRKARLGYPNDFRRVRDIGLAVSPLRAGDFRGRDLGAAQLRPVLLSQRRVWVVGLSPGDPRLGPALAAQAHVLHTHFVRLSERRFGRIDVTLWQRN